MSPVIPIRATIFLNGQTRELTGAEYQLAKEILDDPSFQILSIEYGMVRRTVIKGDFGQTARRPGP